MTNKSMTARCGAKNRRGMPCRLPPIKGKTRCRNHGGESTGPAAENNHLRTHGCYSRYLTPAELEVWPHIRVGTLDDEVKLAKIQILRALTRSKENPDNALFPEILDRLIRTACKLELARFAILGDAASTPADEMAAAIRESLGEMREATAPPAPTKH